MRLGDMTWTEVREAIALRVTAVIPLGSIEEHGPHSPMGDYAIVDEIAARAAELTGDVVAPTIPYGWMPCTPIPWTVSFAMGSPGSRS